MLQRKEHYPQLPPLYFNHVPRTTTTTSNTSLTGLCSELETGILSYLSWGDLECISTLHSSFSTLVHDAACLSYHAKWSYAQALLHGTQGIEQPNVTLAVQYLTELAKNDHSEHEEEDHGKDYNIHNHVHDHDHEPPIHIQAMIELAFLYLEQKISIQEEKDKNHNDHDTSNTLNQHQIQGLHWLQTAFDQHQYLQAAYELAIIYEYGKYDIPVNCMKAAEWFAFAAESGHVDSMYEYALCYELGCGVEQNDQLALDWYTKAANAGCVLSHFSVGEWFESARGGLPQSDTEAVLWYYKAAKMGDEDSIKALKRLNDIARIVVPGWASTLHG